MQLLLLFFPWVNDIKDASAAVPYIGNFWSQHATTWRQALRARTFRNGFPTDEVKRFVLNFCIVYFLPRELQLQDELQSCCSLNLQVRNTSQPLTPVPPPSYTRGPSHSSTVLQRRRTPSSGKLPRLWGGGCSIGPPPILKIPSYGG